MSLRNGFLSAVIFGILVLLSLSLKAAWAVITAKEKHAYSTSANPLPATPAWTADGNQLFANFGSSVASAGDVNGDGYSDVIVGAYLYDNGQADEGRALVYIGDSTGLSITPYWTADGGQAYANFGSSVASAGDVNGDGYSDVIVGAERFWNGETQEGRAFVFLGSSTELAGVPAWTSESNQASASFGNAVSSAGDVNDDGYSDVIVGAYLYDNGEVDEGRALVYHGSSAGLAATPDWTAEGGQADASFGISVASAGDVNGDGYSDVIVGVYLYDNGEVDEGQALVYHGSSAGLAATPDWTAEGGQADASFGISVASAGDVNGDGYSDVIVGAYLYDNGEVDEGRALVYHGSSAGLSTTPAWTAEGDQAYANFGWSVSCAGDVNKDGYSDVIVGAYKYSNPEPSEGRAFIYLGSSTGLSTTPAWAAESDKALAWFGRSAASAGDVDGDGYSDIIVGAPHYNNGLIAEGRAFVYLGSSDISPVTLQGFQSRWMDNSVEVSWTLFDVSSNLTFEIYRKVGSGENYSMIQNPEIIKRGNEFIFLDESTAPDKTYRYRVSIIEDGVVVTSFETKIDALTLTPALHQNRPNPFSSTTTISFILQEQAKVDLSIFNVQGRLVRNLRDKIMSAGLSEVVWDGRDASGDIVSTGLYFYRLKAGKKALTKKMLLIR